MLRYSADSVETVRAGPVNRACRRGIPARRLRPFAATTLSFLLLASFFGTMLPYLQGGTGKAGNLWERISHGFRLSGIVQYYSALPFNITAGSNTIQGTAARPTVNGSFISRNAGTGFDFLNVNARLSRLFPIGERFELEAVAETFNTLNRVNGVTLNVTFGPGPYPTSPSPSFGRTTAVGDPRTLQFALVLRF